MLNRHFRLCYFPLRPRKSYSFYGEFFKHICLPESITQYYVRFLILFSARTVRFPEISEFLK